jgi:flagellar hook-basal body complex protein FliE
MDQGLANLNAQLVSAEQGVQKLASGNAENLHEVMLQLEQARLAMQVAAQVRSRVVEAYQEVMRMQV